MTPLVLTAGVSKGVESSLGSEDRMSFLETVEKARAFLERNGRVSLGALRLEFGLDEAQIQALVEELVEIQQIAVRDEKALAWAGSTPATGPSEKSRVAEPERAPREYTPKHLADKILRSKSALEGERKQVTVLFADVKGSMELAEQIDPEQWHAILERFFQILTEGVHRFEGTINQYTGDGIMALFGAPIAHEDHAPRACYAALWLRDALRDYAQEMRRQHGLDFSTRFGIHSGEVVVGKIGDDLRMDYTAQGHTVGLAQRMEALAEAGRIYLSDDAAQLAAGYLDLEDLGEFRIKGSAEPVRVWDLRGVGEMRTRLDVSRARGFSRFVGRDAEMAGLESALEAAMAGNGQVVGVVADAGTGKSRLCYEFVERCRARGIRVDQTQCPPHGKTVPYLALLEMLRSIFDIDERDSDYEARRKIAGELMLLDDNLQELMPLVFDFLGVPDPERLPPNLAPEARQKQLFAFVRALIEARGRRGPTLEFLDDLHWIDPGSDAFLAQAVESVQGQRVMLLVNFRPDYQASWMGKSYYRQLPLVPLGREAVGELLEDLLGDNPSVAALPDRIFERTGGNPFFVEEVVQSLVESGSLAGEKGAYRLVAPVETLEIPATVQSVLAARIDRLAERDKRLLQTASVIGKEFSESILERVAELSRSDLTASVGALVLAEFVLEKALYPEAEYAFKHPLTQEVALRSQLADRRKALHAAVARAVALVDTDRLDERAALIAHHWEQAGEGLEAARWYRRAAEWVGVRDIAEAFSQWRRLCTVTEGVPESQERSELRLAGLLQTLNLGLRLGLSDEAAATTFAEARQLAGELQDRWSLALAFNTYGVLLAFLGRLSESLEHCEEASRLADRTDDVGLQLFARMDIANTLMHLGRVEQALEVCESALREAPEDPTVGREIRGFSPQLQLRWFWGAFSTLRGRLPEARRALEHGLELARDQGEVEMPGWISFWLADSSCWAGDVAGAFRYARSVLENAEKTGSRLAAVPGHRTLGNAHLAAGSPDEAVHALETSLRISRDEDVQRIEQPLILASLADAYLGRSEIERALATASEAIEVSRRLGTRWKEIPAQLSKARALRMRGDEDAAEGATTARREAEELVKETGARVYLPLLSEERAALAALLGDAAARERHLREAHRLYTEIGATGHAERVGREQTS
jgi:class 3 adenylate cyclase/tetratricopeptide (TPR) repeat protein